jgi:hypothetical protein
MLKKIPLFGLFMLLAAALVVLPVACGSDDNNKNDAAPDTMTGA